MAPMVVPIAYAILLTGSALFAICCGGRPERIAGAIVIIGSLLSAVTQLMVPHPWEGVSVGTFAIDFAMLLSFGAILLTSNRFWPIWATAAQLLTVIAHIGPLLRRAHIAIPFAVSEQLWSWFILLLLILATEKHRRERSRTIPLA